jgi:hypothetical protein
MKPIRLCLVLVLAFGPTLSAGDVFHPDANASGGSLNGLPWSQQEVRYQALVPASVFGGKTRRITELAFAPGASGTFTASQCEITLAHLPTTSRFSTTFAANLQKDKTVMFSGPISWVHVKDQWCPLGLTTVFNYNGNDSVVVEVRFQGGQGGVSCHSGPVGVVFLNGAGSYAAPTAGNIAPLLAPKMRFTYQETVIAASGSPSPGGTIDLDLVSSADRGAAYQVGSSFGTGPIKIDSRRLHLSPDDLLVLSVSGNLPAVFSGYVGTLDTSGKARAKVHIPAIPALKGVRVYSAFVTLVSSAPSGVSNISNSALFTIQ